MRYTDEVEAMLDRERDLRRLIALRIAREDGVPEDEASSARADAAIASWREAGDEEQDLHAFRAMGPLQLLLAEHQALVERIAEMQDRRLG